jgi:cell division control protein 6
MASFDELLSKHTIFRNVSVLSPHYIPKTLPFRDRQIKELMVLLSPALKRQKPKNLIIYGKTGTGKTCTTRKVMEEFGGVESDARMHYLNCRIYNSRYRILQKVLKSYLPELEKAGFGLPYLYEKLLEILKNGHQMVIVLDEVDMIKDLDDLIYTLTRANDEAVSGGVSIIGISNKLSFKDNLDPRSKSSLYETELVFPPYTSEQLQKILEQRSKEGFVEGSVEPSAINLAAAITAQESGDARYALKLLMKAGELAEQNEKEKVDDSDVETARKNVELDLVSETINTLPEMHQVVLHAIASLSMNGSRYSRLEGMENNGFLISGEVYEEYEKVCRKLRKKARSLRWYREYLSELEMLGMITTTPSSKGVRGHTTLIRLGQNPKDVYNITRKNLFGE